MNIKNISAMFVSVFLVVILIFTAVFYSISFKNSSVISDISLQTISGDKSVMNDININGTIGAWNYCDNYYVDAMLTEFIVDIDGNLQTENVNYKMKNEDYRMLKTPTGFGTDFKIIIPKDAKTELLYKQDEIDDGYIGVFSADKFIPYFTFVITHTWWDAFLVIKPDYHIECNGKTAVKYNQWVSNYDEDAGEINIEEMLITGGANSRSTDLTVKIADDYYMVLPTYDNCIGTNGIYKFQMNKDYLSYVNGDYKEDSLYTLEEQIKEQEYRYEKLIDIPINVQGENNKIISKIFEYNNNLIILSTQEIDYQTDKIYASVYDIKTNSFIKEIDLGEFSNKEIQFYSNDEFLTIKSDVVFTTYNIKDFSIVNETVFANKQYIQTLFYSGENLYLYVDEENNEVPRQYDKSTVYPNAKNAIIVYKNYEKLFTGAINTNVYQDYMNGPSIDGISRTVSDITFVKKG